MRICFVAHQATKEGAGRYMLDQIDFLRSAGVDVSVILPSDGPLYDAIAERGVQCRAIASPWWTRATMKTPDPDAAATLLAARRMARAFREWSVDVVYTQTVVVPAGAFAAVLSGLPHIWHIHEFAYNPGAIEMGIAKPALARLIDLSSNIVFFNSKAVAAEWSGALPEDKTAIVYNWVSPRPDDAASEIDDPVAQRLLRSDSTFVIAVVGSVVRWKRQMDAVLATIALVREGLDVALLVVGPAVDGSYMAELREAAASTSASERIHFLGYTEHPHRIMRAADATVVCSDKEPFGRVTVESMAEGTVVIGTNSGGTAEIIEDGVDGILFPTGNVSMLAERLRTLIGDKNLRARLEQKARTNVMRFQSADAAMAPVMTHVTQLVGQRNPSWPLGTVIDSAFGAPKGEEATPLLGRALARLRLLLR